jgi:hypothetical protein
VSLFDNKAYVLNSEIEQKKEEQMPKRGDFFHVKVFRKDENTSKL